MKQIKKNLEAIRAIRDYAKVDIFINQHEGRTFYTTFFRKGERNWTPPTVLTTEAPDAETSQLAALYLALGKLTRNALVQVHGADLIQDKLFHARKPATKAWQTIDAVMKIGLNGHVFDIIKAGDKLNPHYDQVDTYTWSVDSFEAHQRLISTCVAPEAKTAPAPVAKAAPAPVAKSALTAKIEAEVANCTVTAKAEKAAVAKTNKEAA